MIAEKKLETLEHSSAKLTITVGKDNARKEYDELIQKYCKTAQIKGFRKGKVPAPILEQKFGDSIRSEAGMNIIENGLKEAFEEIEKTPLYYAPPELAEEVELELDKDFTFTVTYDYFPEIELGEYKEVEIEEPTTSILAEDIKRELESVQEQNSIVIDKTEGGVDREDIVTMSYVEIDEADEEVPDTLREDFVFTVGSGYNRYKIDDELISMERDQEKVIEKEFPEDFEDNELAGKSVKLKVKVTQIKEKQLPELDDELAQDVSDEYETLDDLKKDIKKRLKETADQHIRQKNVDSIVDVILEQSKVDLPESMVRAELDVSWSSFLSRSGLNEEQMTQVLESQEKTKEDLYGEWRPAAERSIKSRLLLNEIIKREEIAVEDSELDEEIAESAERTNMTAEQAREYFESNNMLEYMRSQLADKKLYDTLLNSAVKKKGKKVKFLDLVQNNQ